MTAKTPAELQSDFERIAKDLGDGISEAVERAVAADRAAIAAWLIKLGREAGCADPFKAFAIAVKNGDHLR